MNARLEKSIFVARIPFHRKSLRKVLTQSSGKEREILYAGKRTGRQKIPFKCFL